jgi:hypothetical protein
MMMHGRGSVEIAGMARTVLGEPIAKAAIWKCQIRDLDKNLGIYRTRIVCYKAVYRLVQTLVTVLRDNVVRYLLRHGV